MKRTADILHSWAHSTEYNNFLEFFDPRRRSQGTSCCPRSTSCSRSSISLPRCHGHWKTLYSCLIGTLAGSRLRWHQFAKSANDRCDFTKSITFVMFDWMKHLKPKVACFHSCTGASNGDTLDVILLHFMSISPHRNPRQEKHNDL